MSWRELNQELEQLVPKFKDDPFRVAYIRTLREINGNLDSIALSLRAIAETADRGRIELSENIGKRILELLDRSEGEADGRRQRKKT